MIPALGGVGYGQVRSEISVSIQCLKRKYSGVFK